MCIRLKSDDGKKELVDQAALFLLRRLRKRHRVVSSGAASINVGSQNCKKSILTVSASSSFGYDRLCHFPGRIALSITGLSCCFCTPPRVLSRLYRFLNYPRSFFWSINWSTFIKVRVLLNLHSNSRLSKPFCITILRNQIASLWLLSLFRVGLAAMPIWLNLHSLSKYFWPA